MILGIGLAFNVDQGSESSGDTSLLPRFAKISSLGFARTD
jgi:hypothetical protein